MPAPIILGPTDLLWQVYHGPTNILDCHKIMVVRSARSSSRYDYAPPDYPSQTRALFTQPNAKVSQQ